MEEVQKEGLTSIFWQKYHSRISEVAYRIPFVGPLFFYWGSHGRAMGEASFLWLFSTLPIVAGIGLAEKGNLSLVEHFEKAISIGQLFIYSATFLSAFVFIAFGALLETEWDRKKHAGSLPDLIFRFPWFYYYSVAALIILIVTAIIYGGTVTSVLNFKKTIIYELFSDLGLYIYIISVYLWYLAILHKVFPGRNYSSEKTVGERKTLNEFKKRVAAGGVSNGG